MLLMFDMGHEESVYYWYLLDNDCISCRNCGLDVTWMSQYTCRSRNLGHWNAWYSSPMEPLWQTRHVRSSLGV